NALSAGRMSAATRADLTRRGIGPYFEQHPADALIWLHQVAISPAGDPDDVFALAEGTFLEGARTGDRAQYLASALAAWAFLFPVDPALRPDRFDPRVRIAADIYNRALTIGFASDDGTRVDIASGSHTLPWGALAVSFDERELEWGDRRLGDFVPVAEFSVEGLTNRYRRPGIGAPLAATTYLPSEALPAAHQLVAKRVKVPVTAILRFDQGALASQSPSARFEIHPASESDSVDVAGELVPLEVEPTSSLAYMLT